ncbi:hypothetical protein THAOC_32585, partial [Thalassiosira oceanica]
VIDCDDCIHCDEGFAVIDGVRTDTTCADACEESGGTCCDGEYIQIEIGDEIIEGNPCSGFTGKVKPNGACSGNLACYNSTIDFVSDSCIGFGACALSGGSEIKRGSRRMLSGGSGGYAGGYVTNVMSAALAREEVPPSGNVHLIDDSCRGNAEMEVIGPCEYLAIAGGKVGEVVSSCNGKAGLAYDGGKVGEVVSSCNNGTEGEGLRSLEPFLLYHNSDLPRSACDGLAYEQGRHVLHLLLKLDLWEGSNTRATTAQRHANNLLLYMGKLEPGQLERSCPLATTERRHAVIWLRREEWSKGWSPHATTARGVRAYARLPITFPLFGDALNSDLPPSACENLAYDGGKVGEVVSSCNNGKYGEGCARLNFSSFSCSLTSTTLKPAIMSLMKEELS